jgi:hypothetical protein
MPPLSHGHRIGASATPLAAFGRQQFRQAARQFGARAILRKSALRRRLSFQAIHRPARTTKAIVEDYLALCRNPRRDFPRWIAQCRKARSKRFPSTHDRKDRHAHTPSPRLASPGSGIRNDVLPTVHGGLDAGTRWAGDSHRLPSQPGSGAGQFDKLRPLRTEGGRAGDAPIPAEASGIAPSSTLASEIGAANGYYAARIATAIKTLPPAEAAAAIRAIQTEKKLAIRAIIERWQAYFQNQKGETVAAKSARPLLQLPKLG